MRDQHSDVGSRLVLSSVSTLHRQTRAARQGEWAHELEGSATRRSDGLRFRFYHALRRSRGLVLEQTDNGQCVDELLHQRCAPHRFHFLQSAPTNAENTLTFQPNPSHLRSLCVLSSAPPSASFSVDPASSARLL